MHITDTLVAEHGLFRSLFDFVEFALAEPATLREVRLLGCLIGVLLGTHGEAEENLVLVALDQALAEKGQLDRLHLEHRELDDRLQRVQSARDLPEARRLLKEAMAASRKHFEHEERAVFPLVNTVLQGQTLELLNEAWTQQRQR